MPEFHPFRGIRYRLAPAVEAPDLSAVTAPPYDVIDEERRESLEAADEHNSVHLILPRETADGTDRYRAAALSLERWRETGVLAVDDHPRFYGYRMVFADAAGQSRSTTGVLGALQLPGGNSAIVGAAAEGVLPHERTMPKAKSDRLALLQATRANLDPIWGLSLTPGLTRLVEPASPPLASCVDHEGVRHELFALDDVSQLDAVRGAIGESPLVLADGHHRFETACTYRDERAAAGVADAGASFIMALVVELADNQLSVGAIHRLLRGLGGIDVPAALSATCHVVPVGANTPDNVGALETRMRTEAAMGLVELAGLSLLVPRRDVVDDALAALPEELRAVDAARFETAVLPELGEPEVTYRDDAASVAALVEKGVAEAAVLLRPVTVEQIRAAAFGRIRMPEKTTFFQPKPCTGFVFRSLDL